MTNDSNLADSYEQAHRKARPANRYGPSFTFLGTPRASLRQPETLAGASAVILGAPFDAGTSYRPGARFGPRAIRSADYLPHSGYRPHLALGVDPLGELGVVDAGDVDMQQLESEPSLQRPMDCVAGVLVDTQETTYAPPCRPAHAAEQAEAAQPRESVFSRGCAVPRLPSFDYGYSQLF